MNMSLKTSAIALAMGLSISGVFAAGTASDTAANYTGGSWSTSPPNLGSGFGAWNFTDDNNNSSGPYAGTYLDQTSYGNSDGVLSAGYAWGTYANGGSGNGYVDMTRSFTAGPSGSTSLYNQTFSVGIGSSGIGGSGQSMSASIGSAFSVGYAGGGPDNMLLSVDGGAATPLPVDFANLNAGLQISLAVSGPLNSATEGYTLTLSPFSGGPAYFVGSGTFDSSTYNTSSFTFADVNTSNDEFANNLNISPEVVPEPSTLTLIGVGVAGLISSRRRK
jgi:hypothetical protein